MKSVRWHHHHYEISSTATSQVLPELSKHFHLDSKGAPHIGPSQGPLTVDYHRPTSQEIHTGDLHRIYTQETLTWDPHRRLTGNPHKGPSQEIHTGDPYRGL